MGYLNSERENVVWKDCLARVVDIHAETNKFGVSAVSTITLFFPLPHLSLSSIDQTQLKFQGACKMGKSEEEPRGMNKINLAWFPVFFSSLYREEHSL